MTIEHAAQNVGNRFFHIGPGHQNGKYGRYIARTLLPRPGPFCQRHDHMRGRRGKAPQARLLPAGQSDLAVGFGKTRNGIGKQQDVVALIAKMFGHGHRRPGTAPADQRRLIRGGSDHNRARHTVRAQHGFDEFANLAAAFAYQGDDHQICRHAPREF